MDRAYIYTGSGRRFYFDDPLPGLDLRDVAHALSNLCRWTGHTREFYSVAQHSLEVSKRSRFPLHALLHDASEAYLNDVNKPLKMVIGPVYQEIEALVQTAIYRRFIGGSGNLSEERQAEIKGWDMRVAVWESRHLLNQPEVLCYEGVESLKDPFPIGYDPSWAEMMFFERFKELGGVD